MPISWFDKPKHGSGLLSVKLATDCHTVNSLITTYFCTLIQCTTILVVGVVIAFIYEWRTAGVAVCLLPMIVLAGLIHMKLIQGFSAKTDRAYK